MVNLRRIAMIRCQDVFPCPTPPSSCDNFIINKNRSPSQKQITRTIAYYMSVNPYETSLLDTIYTPYLFSGSIIENWSIRPSSRRKSDKKILEKKIAEIICIPSGYSQVSSQPKQINMTTNSNQVEDLDGVSSGIVGSVLLVVLGTAITYIMLCRYDRENKKHEKAYFLALLCAVFIEFILVMVYLGFISENTKALPSERRGCALYINAPISTYSSYTDNYTTYSSYSIHGCNAYVSCESSIWRYDCSLGNAIEHTALVGETFVQDDWLKGAICPFLNSFEGSADVKPSAMFRRNMSRKFVMCLYCLCCFYYIAFIYYWVKYTRDEEKERTLDVAKALCLFHISRLWLLPLNALSPVPNAKIGCDLIVTHASLYLSIPMMVFAVAFGLSWIVWFIQKKEAVCCGPKLLRISLIPFLLAVAVFISMIADSSNASTALILTTINPQAFSLTLSPNTPRSICFFCIQVIALLRAWATVLQLCLRGLNRN